MGPRSCVQLPEISCPTKPLSSRIRLLSKAFPPTATPEGGFKTAGCGPTSPTKPHQLHTPPPMEWPLPHCQSRKPVILVIETTKGSQTYDIPSKNLLQLINFYAVFKLECQLAKSKWLESYNRFWKAVTGFLPDIIVSRPLPSEHPQTSNQNLVLVELGGSDINIKPQPSI